MRVEQLWQLGNKIPEIYSFIKSVSNSANASHRYKTGGGIRADLFAATPPLEVFKALVSLAATNQAYVLDFIDVKKAH